MFVCAFVGTGGCLFVYMNAKREDFIGGDNLVYLSRDNLKV